MDVYGIDCLYLQDLTVLMQLADNNIWSYPSSL